MKLRRLLYTVAILAQGTHRADAATQAFLCAIGSIPSSRWPGRLIMQVTCACEPPPPPPASNHKLIFSPGNHSLSFRFAGGSCAKSIMRCPACRCGVPTKQDCLQGCLCESADTLAVNDPGIGSGWQQSKQNWAHLAVVGECRRMRCRCLCCEEVLQLSAYFMVCAPLAHCAGGRQLSFGFPSGIIR